MANKQSIFTGIPGCNTSESDGPAVLPNMLSPANLLPSLRMGSLKWAEVWGHHWPNGRFCGNIFGLLLFVPWMRQMRINAVDTFGWISNLTCTSASSSSDSSSLWLTDMAVTLWQSMYATDEESACFRMNWWKNEWKNLQCLHDEISVFDSQTYSLCKKQDVSWRDKILSAHKRQRQAQARPDWPFWRIGMLASCTCLLAEIRPPKVLQLYFSHGLNPASVISDGVTRACLRVPASPWETLDEMLLWERKKEAVQELTCHGLSDMHEIWLSQSAVAPFLLHLIQATYLPCSLDYAELFFSQLSHN